MSGSALQLDAKSMLDVTLNGIKLIEASAGTGKTYTIANLYLRHILDGKSTAEILVVTFTNAATEELRGRIRLRLFTALKLFQQPAKTDDEFLTLLLDRHKSQNSEQQRLSILRLQLALRSMDEAAISTIHSFCQRVLQDHALAGKQYFDYELLTDDDSLWQSAIRDWWRKATYTLQLSELGLLYSSIGSFSKFSGWVTEMHHRPAARYIPRTNQDQKDIYRQFRDLEDDLLKLGDQWHESIADIIRHSKVLGRNKKLPYHADNIDSFLLQLNDYFYAQQAFPLPHNFRFLAADVLHENSKPATRGQDPDLDNPFFHTVNSINRIIEALLSTLKPVVLMEAYRTVSERVKKVKLKHQLISYQDQLEFLLEALQLDSSGQLHNLVREQFPVAMIDEFQDTDITQYEIFKSLYYQQDALSLTLIGDPKQAIYSFRGGDIFTYMRAKQLTGVQHCTLQTNWRSQAALVNAVNCFFTYRQDSFIYSASVGFNPATAAPANNSSALIIDNQKQAALTLWHIPGDDKNKPFSKDIAGKYLNRATASEIARLIKGGQESCITIDGRPLQSGDIAILVRSAYEGNTMRQQLEQQGINAVTIGREKVFASEEATGLYSLLEGIAQPASRPLSRRALASSLLYHDYAQISNIINTDTNWLEYSEQLFHLHGQWQSRGFIAMFQQALHSFGLAQRLAQREYAERRLTNLLHLVELLQQQSLGTAGIDDLLSWFRDQMHESISEEAELRLESDQALVKIVTIHKSKGLEYPVVFLPYLWSCKSQLGNKDSILHFHDSKLEACTDLGSAQIDESRILADKERLAEDLRLLYVALTRARNKVYLAWGQAGQHSQTGDSSLTALAYLLHAQQSAADLDTQALRTRLKPETLLDELQSFVRTTSGDVELKPLPLEAEATVLARNHSVGKTLQASNFKRRQASPWRVNSFSGLTRDVHQVEHHGSTALSDDPILKFPAGSRTGLLLHEMLEHLDFQLDVMAQCRVLIAQLAPRFNLGSGEQEETLIDWLRKVLHTPLCQPGLCLAVLSNRQRLNELVFDFAIEHVEIDQLNRLLAQLGSSNVQPLYAADFRGLITGVIDLVFEFKGKYYLADYKSNMLGTRLDDYSPAKLTRAMLDRRYDLQSLIYSVALHRYLRQRLPNYDYHQHFGGSYYLFMRAMRPQSGPAYGVHFEKPAFSDMLALDQLFSDGSVA
ncbi:MAG: exodeoxyribonuclease V subunit beta [Gammaproteobacteria bacterium]|nr:exodeoxyribonuclease V subunit beta [Gammaproteobacteria bacterium]